MADLIRKINREMGYIKEQVYPAYRISMIFGDMDTYDRAIDEIQKSVDIALELVSKACNLCSDNCSCCDYQRNKEKAISYVIRINKEIRETESKCSPVGYNKNGGN